MSISSINPNTGELVREFGEVPDIELEQALVTAKRGFAAHKLTRIEDRAKRMRALADRLDNERDELANLITDEMGKR